MPTQKRDDNKRTTENIYKKGMITNNNWYFYKQMLFASIFSANDLTAV